MLDNKGWRIKGKYQNLEMERRILEIKGKQSQNFEWATMASLLSIDVGLRNGMFAFICSAQILWISECGI